MLSLSVFNCFHFFISWFEWKMMSTFNLHCHFERKTQELCLRFKDLFLPMFHADVNKIVIKTERIQWWRRLPLTEFIRLVTRLMALNNLPASVALSLASPPSPSPPDPVGRPSIDGTAGAPSGNAGAPSGNAGAPSGKLTGSWAKTVAMIAANKIVLMSAIFSFVVWFVVWAWITWTNWDTFVVRLAPFIPLKILNWRW